MPGAAFALCALLPGLAAAQAPEPEGLPEITASTSDPELQFRILTGEMAAQRQQPGQAAIEFLAVLDKLPDAALASRTTGLALASGSIDLVDKAAHRWLEIEPNSGDAREVLLKLALDRGQLDEAFAQCDAIVSGHAGGPDDGLRQVALLLAQLSEKPEPALPLAQRLAAKYPQQAGAHYALGLLAFRYDRAEQAEASARQALKLKPDSKEYALLLTGILVKGEKFAEADGIIDGLTKRYPQERDDLRLAYAKLLLESDHTEEAKQQLQVLAKANPKNVDARFGLAMFALNANQLDAAAAEFNKLTADADRGPDARYQLGRIAEKQNRLPDALKQYESIKSGRQALDARLRMAAVLIKLNQADEAHALLEGLREQFPPLTRRLLLAEGEMLTEAGRRADALALYSAGIKQNPKDADLLYGRSLVYDGLGRYAESEADLRAVLAQNADDPRALNALGYLLLERSDKYKEASELIGKALKQAPEDPAIIDSMGWAQYKLGRKDEALSLLKKAHALHDDPEIAAHYGEVLWVSGQRDEARAVWKKALAGHSDHVTLKATVERLDKATP